MEGEEWRVESGGWRPLESKVDSFDACTKTGCAGSQSARPPPGHSHALTHTDKHTHTETDTHRHTVTDRHIDT